MSPSASIDFRSALQVAPERIARLKDAELGVLMGQLLRAQSYLCGAGVSELRTNTEEKAPDGGADAWSGKPDIPDPWLGDTQTCWQLKAGAAGNPARVRGEIGKPLPNEYLKKGGRFVLVASGSTSGKKGETERLKTLTTEANALGLPIDRIVVFGSERLAEWVNQHPAIAARWAARPEGLCSLQDWPVQKHQASWQAIDSLTAALESYRQSLDPTRAGDEPCMHLHIHGPPGAGKTRLALELCREAPWADFAVYVLSARESNVLDLLTQTASEEGVRCVVVADDTPADKLKPLRDALERSEGRVRLITLGTSHSPDPRRIQEEKLTPLSADNIRALLGCWYPAMAAELVSNVVNLAAGNPGLASLAANALDKNPALTTATLIEQDAIQQLLEAIAGHNKPLGRSDWSWPGGAWDFATFRKERREGFVRRDWLRQKVREWALNPDAAQALMIVADYGVGKTAFLAWLLDADQDGEGVMGPGLAVVAQHFCRWEANPYLSPGRFVQSLACQLKDALPAYRQAVEADQAQHRRRCLDEAETEPLLAFQQGVVEPLATIAPPATSLLIVVDALDEALGYRANSSGGVTLTIVDLLAKEARQLPGWLRVLATSRRKQEVVKPLSEGFFKIDEINAESDDNLDDIESYAKDRCQQLPLAEKLHEAGLLASDVAEVVRAKSGGKFLYAVCVLNDVTNGALPIRSRQSLDELPPGMDGFYKQTFERRYAEETSYAEVKPILGLLCAQLEPLTYHAIAAILKTSPLSVARALKPLNDLLHLLPVPDAEGGDRGDRRCSLAHISLEQWLSQEKPDDLEHWAGRFAADRAAAEEQIRSWALAEIAAHRAHTWSYLVRNLAELFTSQSGVDCLSSLLCNYKWIKRRLKLSGVNAILSDIDAIPRERLCSEKAKALDLLRQVIGQSSHVLGNEKAWNGSDQLETQLLIRLAVSDNKFINECLSEAKKELVLMQIPYPLQPSLFSLDQRQAMMDKANPACLPVVLRDDILAYSNRNHDIILWSLTKRKCLKKLEGHRSDIRAIQAMGEDRLISGSMYGTIKVWNLLNDECQTVDHHTEAIKDFIKLSASDFLSYSTTEIVRWRLSEGQPIFLQSAKIEKEINLLHKVDNDDFICLSTDQKLFYFSFSRNGYISLPIFVDKILHCQPWLEARWLIGTSSQFYIWDPYPLNQANKHATECDRARIDKRPFDLVLLKAISGGDLFALSHSRHLFAWRNGDLKADPREFELISNLEQFVDIGFSRLAQVSSNGDISIKTLDNTATPIRTSTSRSVVSAIEFLDDYRIVVIHGDGLVRICHVDESGISDICSQSGSQISSQSDLAILDNSTFITSSETGDLLVWNLDNTANILTTIQVIDFRSACKFNKLGAAPLFISSLSRNRFIAADLHNIIVYDINQNRLPQLDNPKWMFGNKHKKLISVLTHNGMMFAMWEPKSSLNELTIASITNSPVEGVYPDFTPVRACAALPNDMIASATSSHEIVIWEKGTSKPIRVLRGHTSWIRDLVRIEGNIILSCSDDQTMRIWDTSDETARGTIALVSDSRITSLAYKSIQRKVVAGDQEGNIHLFSH